MEELIPWNMYSEDYSPFVVAIIMYLQGAAFAIQLKMGWESMCLSSVLAKRIHVANSY